MTVLQYHEQAGLEPEVNNSIRHQKLVAGLIMSDAFP